MTNALFDINADGLDDGYAASNSEVLAFKLRANPATGVRTVLFQVWDPGGYDPDLSIAANPPMASKGAPTLTLTGATTGQAVSPPTPTGEVTTALPALGTPAYKVRCVVNGGVNTFGRPDPELIHERIVAVTNLDLRKIIITEASEYEEDGWAGAFSDLVDRAAQSGFVGSGAWGQGSVAGVAATPGWEVLGAFVLESPGLLRLDAIALVSQGALSCRIRLYDLTLGAEVAGSPVSTSATTDTRLTSGDLQAAMTVGNLYQIQAECTGGALGTDFADIRYAMARGA